MDTLEFAKELFYFVNETEIQEELKYIIKLSQILWVNALVKDEELSKGPINVIKMKSNFIQNYEKELVESAEEKTKQEIAEKMKKENYSAHEIQKITGVTII